MRGQARIAPARAAARRRSGVDRRGLGRLRCRACKRTCSASAGSALAGLRRPEAFREVVRDMICADRPASCRRLAERHRLDKTTVWRWRMHSLAVLEQATGALGGVVEADQTTRRESRKGSREWVRYAREPQTQSLSEKFRPCPHCVLIAAQVHGT